MKSLLLLALVAGAASVGPLESVKVCVDAIGSGCSIPKTPEAIISLSIFAAICGLYCTREPRNAPKVCHRSKG